METPNRRKSIGDYKSSDASREPGAVPGNAEIGEDWDNLAPEAAAPNAYGDDEPDGAALFYADPDGDDTGFEALTPDVLFDADLEAARWKKRRRRRIALVCVLCCVVLLLGGAFFYLRSLMHNPSSYFEQTTEAFSAAATGSPTPAPNATPAPTIDP